LAGPPAEALTLPLLALWVALLLAALIELWLRLLAGQERFEEDLEIAPPDG